MAAPETTQEQISHVSRTPPNSVMRAPWTCGATKSSTGFAPSVDLPHPNCSHNTAPRLAQPGRHVVQSHDQQVHSALPALSRRAALQGMALLPMVHPGAALASRPSLQQDPRVKPLQAFWQELVVNLQQQLSDGFAPNLVFYGPGELLPSGTPGDPAAEYNKRAACSCGTLASGFVQPYAICPDVPGAVADTDTARDCCRHFAFAVPRSRYAFAAMDRQTSVVASPRLALAAAATWQGVLVHEIGHCIDFFAFPQRYQLPVEPVPRSAAAAAALAAIDVQEADAELRADLMSNALLAPVLGQKLCYSSLTRVQSLVPPSTTCSPDVPDSSSGDSDPSAPTFMQHFPHPPVAA